VKRQAVPEYEWQRQRTFADTVRLVVNFVFGALFLGGVIALLLWLFLFWKPAP
jgi:hypothetical protein